MNAALMVLLAWLLFAGTHLLMGLPACRDVLVRSLGEQKFVAVFSAVAAIGLAVLAATVAIYGGDGARGLALGSVPAVHALLAMLAFLGLSLSMAGLLNYVRSPMALFRTQLRPAAGIERVTRHAFFMGLTLFATAHALLVPTLALCIYFVGFALLATIGAVLQDRKLLVRHGTAYRDYMAVTSLIPFAALVQGRQAISVDDRLIRQFALSAALALLLLALHPLWSLHHGAPFAGAMAVGGVFAAARRWHFRERSPLATD
ncbi:MAG: NnrU family protein [Pseudomonadota bacterium]|nr:NnrU family protein [Pseudomonadota bacterium]